MNANEKLIDISFDYEMANKTDSRTLKDWMEDFNLEFGKSDCHCCICHESFRGFKHRVICKECGDKLSMNLL